MVVWYVTQPDGVVVARGNRSSSVTNVSQSCERPVVIKITVGNGDAFPKTRRPSATKLTQHAVSILPHGRVGGEVEIATDLYSSHWVRSSEGIEVILWTICALLPRNGVEERVCLSKCAITMWWVQRSLRLKDVSWSLLVRAL